MLNVTALLNEVVSSLFHTVWPNSVSDVAVPCGFARPRWKVRLRESVHWVEEILLVEIRRVNGERHDWWRPRRLMLHGTLYLI